MRGPVRLPEILLLVLSATIAGADDFVETTLWGTRASYVPRVIVWHATCGEGKPGSRYCAPVRSPFDGCRPEACLVRADCRLLRLCCGSGEHPPRRQLVDPIDRMPCGNVCQDSLEVCLGICASCSELCRLHECIDGSGTLAADIGATEEVVLPPDRHRGPFCPYQPGS